METKLDILMRKQREATDPAQKNLYKKEVDRIVELCINTHKLERKLERDKVEMILATA